VALVTGTNNGTMIDLEANTWTVGDNVYSGFKSINGTEFDGAEDEEDDDEVVTATNVTLQDVTVDNTAEYDTWYVTCGSIAKAGIPTGGEMVQLLEVLKAAVESGRDITLIFSDITSVSGSLFYEGDAAAYAQYLTDVQFPAVTNCSNSHVFRDCTNLRRFSAPLMSSSNKIGNYYFAGCTSLVAVNAPDGEEGVYIPDAITAISNFVFQNCSSIPSFYGAAIEVLGNSDFAGCTSLTSLEVATTSTSLTTGTTLFGSDGTLIDLNKVALVTGTNNGTMIDLEANTWTVGDNVYSGFKSINGTEFDGTEDEEDDDDEVVTATNVTLQDVTVDNTAEFNTWYVACGSITSTGKPIADEMIQLFTVLAAAVESGRDITLIFTDMTATTSLFTGNTDITVLEFPAVTTMASASTFEGCTNLRSVSADICTKFHNKCFNSCPALEYVYGPKIETLGTNLMLNCTSLKTIEVATTSTTLSTNAATLFAADNDADLSGIDLITGANNGSIVDTTDGINSWTIGDYTFTGFKSITIK
ncbi:MAG: leucine-rich repeat protein, partial [Rikenellaceae bacterium]